ncbi:MAG: carboxypeptidase-like regulatory domain-containing protein, partial [Acidobacteriota bacterium]|nr:carboxypeptidase-like regulatory domain-containing protein [Acidobacteriota bacterium]
MVAVLCAGLAAAVPAVAAAGATSGVQDTARVRVTGRVLDAVNAQPLPGVAVTVAGTDQTVVTDLDGRYVLMLPVG